MCAQITARSPDLVISALASRQHGVVSRDQLLDAGVTRAQIALRVRNGRLTPLHRGVYLVGPVPSEFAYSQAALLACGSAAALSHRSAAWLWGLRDYSPRAHPWLTVPPSKHVVRPKVVVHRAPLEARDVRSKTGLALVSPPRTILDCAAIVGDAYELEALVAEASFRKLALEHELTQQIARNKGRPGVSALREVLDLEGGPQKTRSGGERWFLRLLRENGFSGFEFNAKVHGKEVDCLWRDLDFCVELDGWDGHSSRLAFERDRVKWAHLDANGVDVMPIATRQAQRDVMGTIGRLRRALERRGRTVRGGYTTERRTTGLMGRRRNVR
jgi:very-short-patch-repair endonuclease